MTIVVIVSSCILMYVYAWIYTRLRLFRLHTSRQADDCRAFKERSRQLDIPDNIANEVIAYLRHWTRMARFEVRSDDDLAEIYGFDDEDLDDAILIIAKRCKRDLPREMPATSCPRSVADLALIVNSFLRNGTIVFDERPADSALVRPRSTIGGDAGRGTSASPESLLRREFDGVGGRN